MGRGFASRTRSPRIVSSQRGWHGAALQWIRSSTIGALGMELPVSCRVLDGRQIALEIRAEVAQIAAEIQQTHGRPAALAAILVGDDPASQVYVRNKEKACAKAGIESRLIRLPASTSQADLLARIELLNHDDDVNGILVQLPLPKDIDSVAILDAIAPAKDVDAFHPDNVGRLCQGRPRYLPCTPHGIVQLLGRCQLTTRGKHVVVVGRSDIVGKPMANMLVQRDSSFGADYANATVTIAHSASRDLESITRSADILIAAVGRPKFITAEMVQTGAVVIDVGINRTSEGLVGDVDFESVKEVASAITPVPGGVGPLTVAMLLHNTVQAAKAQKAGHV